ncbi:MAG: MBL fold metallo-hydrolase [Betaproteobacteria bacterium]|nr:MBL fold metallo-hydrolase [Betaproteobacteria bacterium]
MKLQQISESCFAVLNEKGRLCDSNSGFINRGGGVLVDTQSDLSHTRRMASCSGASGGMPKRVINTNESGDHVWGNQVFAGAEIIAHRTVPDRMMEAAGPLNIRRCAMASMAWCPG